MSTSRKSSQSQSTNTNVNTEEKTMTTQNTTNTQSTNNNNNNKFFNIIVASGRKIAVPEETAYLLLSVANTALKEYERKAEETVIGKTNPKPKDPNSIKYDKNMLFRMQAMHAFIHKVLEGISLPEKDNASVIDQLNNL